VTIYSAPPDQTGIVLNNGDILNVGLFVKQNKATATSTTVNNKGTLRVGRSGTSQQATINTGGVEFVTDGGVDNNSTIEGGTVQIQSPEFTDRHSGANNMTVNDGSLFVGSFSYANGTTLNGGQMFVELAATANNLTVNNGVLRVQGKTEQTVINGGTVEVEGGSLGDTTINGGKLVAGGFLFNTTIADGILDASGPGIIPIDGGIQGRLTFAGPLASVLLGVPKALSEATISGWAIGDVIDSRQATTTGVVESGDKLIVNYTFLDTSASSKPKPILATATLKLENQQADTAVTFRSDGQGGSELFLTAKVTGSSSADVLVGSTGTDYLSGEDGNDVLYGDTSQATGDVGGQTVLEGDGGSNALYGSSGYTLFKVGDANGGANQVWGAASKMAGVAGFTNNTLSFEDVAAGKSVYADLLNGHNAYINDGANNNGAYTLEDSIVNVPNVIGSSGGDIIIADNEIARIEGRGGADALYAGGGADTFVYSDYGDSNLLAGYDTVVGFKIGIDKIDLSGMGTDASHLVISTSGVGNALYLEATPGTLNPATDLAINVVATTGAGLTASDFNF
jgi:autotransporter passenger strand-loop-strand repeat protein